MSEKFNLDMIEKTFTSYKKGQIFDGVVVLRREDGVIFNIGGKNDAFISKEDFEDYDQVKIGDRFGVVITNQKNEEGLIEASKSLADALKVANQNAQSLRLGSKFTFVPTRVENGLVSKMGDYSILVPFEEVSENYVKNFQKFVGTQLEAVVTEIDKENKSIIASVKLLQQQLRVAIEKNFWNSIFINKIVKGKVERIMPYGAFVSVDGFDCFLHISNIGYEKLEKVEDALKVGEEKQFKVVSLDRENKKVELSLKALLEDPKTSRIKQLNVGDVYQAEVVKLLRFGAIVKVENGATGLLHISNCTENKTKNIYELVKVGDKVEVELLSKDEEEQKVSFKLKTLID
ncbi:MAG: S1 RNA-binding domain-containing protein [Clostridiales bacterium]|nr:S1 RNA-binding domain-containing protein [Clostridiales bacterium]